MFNLSTWLRSFAGALIACLLVIGLAAPSARAGECIGDAYVAAQHFETGGASVSAKAESDGKSDVGGGEICHKGHCHHAPAPVPPTGAVVAEILQSGVRLMPPALAIPPSRIPDGAKEPPRA